MSTMPKNISDLSQKELKHFIDSIDVVLTDCDGVLWLYNNIIDGSNDVINRLIEMNKKIYFITNNSTKTREELAEKARMMNFNVGLENMISTAYLAVQYLKQQNFDKKVFIIGSTGISRELDAAGLKHCGVGPDVMTTSLQSLIKDEFKPDSEVGAVIVGFDEHISFPKILKAATYLDKKSTIFIATNTDERFPMPNFVVPGTGAIVRAVETCAERKAIVMGKPENYLCEIFFKDEIKRDSKRFLMIGDRLNTDILFGKNNSFQTLLVGTGVHKLDKVSEIIEDVKRGNTEEQNQIPDFYIDKLGDLFNNY